MPDYFEIVPVSSTQDEPQPLSKRRHFVRRRDGANRQIEWTKQPYSNRSNAKRAINNDASLHGLEIRVVGYQGETLSTDVAG